MVNKKSNQNNIIAVFAFYLIWVIVITFLFLNKGLSQFDEINKVKKDTNDIYENILRIKKEWVTLSEFKSNIPNDVLSSNSFIGNIINDLDEKFYNDFFKNKTELEYDKFIEDILNKYSDRWNFNKNISVISSILPLYSNISNFWDESSEVLKEFIENNDLLSDFKFINYVERLTNTFNLSHNSNLWVDKLFILDWYSIWEWSNSLETNIYYIPLQFNITTTKSLLLDFLYFIENVWKVSLEWNELYFNNSDSVDFQNFKNIYITWDKRSSSYNIFDNIIMDVYSLNISEYLDNNYDVINDNKTFVDFIKTSQWNQRVNASMEVRFYVKWLPSYIIEDYLTTFIWKFNDVEKELNLKIWDNSTTDIKKEELIKIRTELSRLRLTLLPWITKSISTKADIEKSYNEAYKYNSFLNRYLEIINK
jgi:hypothetical protein